MRPNGQINEHSQPNLEELHRAAQDVTNSYIEASREAMRLATQALREAKQEVARLRTLVIELGGQP